ncbi:Zinc-binding GTPase YeiR [Vibrio chagasii]|uniref:CobW family GTP-binding protein n=1 Tax=Vibrio TaxID=662 RepID=UPI000E3253F4|nr:MULTISPECIES: GTP-binding protein [Vibrio]MDE9381623.1 GTP-binding protein [Vibrio alginolyticus]MCG9606020.1 GTP-binding protein [Vibrio chagasii]MCG9673766.1 GTP-binding protein [Vibrio chagasii]NOI86144.1 GTP-binding protein [Vibrio sp. 99K-1]CAH6801463.1 Zinc-binding GTPase YeiR [Vibrio chagasii]
MTKKVPTNIITGFLGVGKTTAILNLLKNKPENENWAVLVNEFGEIGIDGALMTDQGALIKEVPGGCMCCTAGVPMSVGINALLRQKPDRLLIEPTGLGHPKQVIATLTSDQYTPYVDLKATLGLVDPRNLSNEKYTSNQNFNDQLDSADVILGTKVDLVNSEDIDVFNDWVTDQTPAKVFHKLIHDGEVPLEVLDIERVYGSASTHLESHHHDHAEQEPQFELPPGEAFIRKENKGQGYFSCGWLFGAEYKFDFDALFSMLSDLTAERVKAVVNTDQGCFAFNVANQVVSVNEITLDGFESRLEVIDSQLMPWGDLEQILLNLCGIK